MKYELKITKGLQDNPDAAEIRKKVFIEEQGFVNEFDEIDEKAYHLVIYVDKIPAATGRIYYKESPDVQIIGRLAVIKELRGKALGKLLINELEKLAVKNNAEIVELSAQERVKDFYLKSGYNQVSGVYFDELCPHILMQKNLKQESAYENKNIGNSK